LVIVVALLKQKWPAANQKANIKRQKAKVGFGCKAIYFQISKAIFATKGKSKER
jgi:hypothetical protein